MVKWLDFDQDLAEACAAEFLASPAGRATYPKDRQKRPRFLRLDGASDAGFPRFVLRMQIGRHAFALKLNQATDGRLAAEFRMLERLERAFGADARLGVVRPLYLSRCEEFHVTAFDPAEPALDRIARDADPAPVYRRAGEWLAGLHALEPAETAGFRPKWVLARLDTLVATERAGGPHAPAALTAPMIATLRRDAAQLRGRPAPRVMAHGDFHPGNLLVSDAGARGLDFFKARRKPALDDIVDFLRHDALRDGPLAGIDRGGILHRSRAAFLQGYGETVDPEILDFALRAKLLVTWLGITREMHARSAFQRDKQARLRARLERAFDQG